MNWKGTIGLMLVALALLGYVLLFERPAREAGSEGGRARRLFPQLQPAQVTSVEIVRSNRVIRAERQEGSWRLADPSYPAQAAAIDEWLNLVSQSHQRASLAASELLAQPGGLSYFGLEHPAASVRIEQGPLRFHFRLGARTPVGGQLYLQPVGFDGVLVTEAALWERLPQAAADWRDPAFLDLTAVRFDRLQVRTGSRDFELQRGATDRLWRLTKPLPVRRADQGRLEQLLQLLQATRVSQFANDHPTADVEPYGLQTPDVALTFAQGTNPLLTVEFGRAPTNDPSRVYARRSTYPNIVTVPRTARDALAVPYTEFLSYQLMDRPLAGVQRVEVRADETFVLQLQTNGSWRVVQPFEVLADPALVQGFLAQVSGLRIADVAKDVVTDLDLPTYGLAPPRRQYLFRSAPAGPGTNVAPLLQLDVGTNRADRVFVRRGDENAVYQVRLEDCLALPQAAFEMRDRRLWDFTTNQVTRLTVTGQGQAYTLQRSPGGRWAFAPGSQGMVNPFALEEAVFRLGQLRARAWVAQGAEARSRYGFDAVAHRLSVELGGTLPPRTLTVEFGATSPSGGPFALVELEGGATVFEFPFDVYQPYEEAVRGLLSAERVAP